MLWSICLCRLLVCLSASSIHLRKCLDFSTIWQAFFSGSTHHRGIRGNGLFVMIEFTPTSLLVNEIFWGNCGGYHQNHPQPFLLADLEQFARLLIGVKSRGKFGKASSLCSPLSISFMQISYCLHNSFSRCSKHTHIHRESQLDEAPPAARTLGHPEMSLSSLRSSILRIISNISIGW